MVTLYDVARRAAVSTATVSRVVHGQDRVREATRIRVQQAIEELGYVPDGAGQSLSRRRKDIIGMLCVEREKAGQHDIETECLLYYDEVQRGVQERIRGSQWLLLSTFMQADGTGEPGLSGLDPLSGKVDGILVGEGFAASRRIQRLAARLPVVVIAGTLGAQAADVVAADNFSGAAALITHLIADHGRRRLFHVGGPPNSPDAIQRRLALDHALRSHPHCQLIGSAQGIFSIASGEQAGEELLARHRAAHARRRGVRQRPDGNRRPESPHRSRRPRPRRGSRDRLRRPLSRPPGRSAAQHRPPADAHARRASLRPAARPHRPPGPVPGRAAAAHRARAAVKLRLPARHAHPPARPSPQARLS